MHHIKNLGKWCAYSPTPRQRSLPALVHLVHLLLLQKKADLSAQCWVGQPWICNIIVSHPMCEELVLKLRNLENEFDAVQVLRL